GPLPGDPQRGAYLSWLSYYSGVFEPAFMCKFANVEMPRPAAGWANLDEVMRVILERLGGGPYLLGENYSAVDVLYGSTFAMFARSELLPKSPLIEAYARAYAERPAVARAAAREAG